MHLGNWIIETVITDNPKSLSLSLTTQTHQCTIIPAEEIEPGKTEADGVVVLVRGKAAGISTADCLPLVITALDAALLLHVSRKSLIAGLLDAVPRFIKPMDMVSAWLGPCICERHFVFDWEGQEITKFRARFPQAAFNTGTQVHLSLQQATQSYLSQWNIPQNRIYSDGRCTFEDDTLPSYRRWLQEGKQGSLAHLITTVRYAPTPPDTESQ